MKTLSANNSLPKDVGNYSNEWIAYFEGDEFILDHDIDPNKLMKKVRKKELAFNKKVILFFSTPKGSCFY